MLASKWVAEGIDILLAAFTVYLFFFYFRIFFKKRGSRLYVLSGVIVILFWQLMVSDIVRTSSVVFNIGVTVGVTLLAVISIFEGKFWKKCFFTLVFDTIWMLLETLLNDFLMISCERLAFSQNFGSLASKLLFLMVIIALKKVLTNEEVMELPASRSILLIFIPIGSIYIMNAVFILASRTGWKKGETYSLVSAVILLLINVLVFYIYIKLAEDQQVRRRNMVYEQQLELCERHQEETELSMLRMRDVRHGMKNHLLSILAYAEQGECEKIIEFVDDVIEGGDLRALQIVGTGNIVVDSLVGYWKRTAEQAGIEFQAELSIPMEMTFLQQPTKVQQTQ